MPFFDSSQEWLTQSTLLFQAYPTSSRVTTKYTIHPPPSPDSRKRKRQIESSNPEQPAPESADTKAPPAPKASLTLKTFDPVSGVCLKYRTDKAAEVGRLIASLGRLGKHMAAVPDADAVGDAEKALDAAAEGAAQEGAETTVASTLAAEADSKGVQQGKPGGGGGGKKKKKGKK